MCVAQSQAIKHEANNSYGKPAAPLAASNAMTPLKPEVAPPCSPPNSQSSSTQLGKSNEESVCDSLQAKSILVPAVFLHGLIERLPDETLRELLLLLPSDAKDVWELIDATGKNVGVPKETSHEL
jgi:hypothetical protein